MTGRRILLGGVAASDEDARAGTISFFSFDSLILGSLGRCVSDALCFLFALSKSTLDGGERIRRLANCREWEALPVASR